jgi:hypothetical protein
VNESDAEREQSIEYARNRGYGIPVGFNDVILTTFR